MPRHERARSRQTRVTERDKTALYVNQAYLLSTLKPKPNPRQVTVILDLRRQIKQSNLFLVRYRRDPAASGPGLHQKLDEYPTSFLMADTPNNTSSPQFIVTRSRLNKGGIQLLPPLPDEFFLPRRTPSLTPLTKKGSRARKRSTSRRHTTTGIEVKMETADAEVSVKRETEEVTGEPNMKKETASSSFTAALSEELLKFPLVKLEKCSPEKETRTEEPEVEEEIDVGIGHNNDEPVTPKLESMSPEPTIDKSPRIANTPPAFSAALQTSRTPPHHSTVTILRSRNARSLLIPTPSSPIWQRNIVKSYSMPLVPVTTAAASSPIFAVFQPSQVASSTLTSDPYTSRTPSPVSQFPTSESHILSPEIESSSTPQFSSQSGVSILKEQLTAPLTPHVSKPVIPPKREPVNAMRKLFKSNLYSRTPKARGRLGLKIAQALDIPLNEAGLRALSPHRGNQRRSVDDGKVLTYNELWCSNESQQASTSKTMEYEPVSTYTKLVSQAISDSETMKSKTTASYDTLTLQPKDTSETSQTTSASETVTSQTMFLYEDQLVPQAAATCEVETSEFQSTFEMPQTSQAAICETQTSQSTPDAETQASQTTSTYKMLVSQAIDTCETDQHSPDETLESQATSYSETLNATCDETQTPQQHTPETDETQDKCEILPSQTTTTCEALTAIFEEDWNYHVTLDSVLHSNAPGLWQGDEMDTLLSECNLDKCLFNDETPALFELIGYNEDIEDFTSTPSPEFMNQGNLPENIFDDSDF